MNKTFDLAECPFAHPDDADTGFYKPRLIQEYSGLWFAECAACEARGPIADTAQRAADGWNGRFSEQVTIELVETDVTAWAAKMD